jgi:hypothetical protein
MLCSTLPINKVEAAVRAKAPDSEYLAYMLAKGKVYIDYMSEFKKLLQTVTTEAAIDDAVVQYATVYLNEEVKLSVRTKQPARDICCLHAGKNDAHHRLQGSFQTAW